MDRPFGMLRSVTHGVDAPRSIKKGTVPRIWRFAAPYRRGLAAFLLFTVVSSVVGVVTPILAGRVVDTIVARGDAAVAAATVVGLAAGIAALAIVEAVNGLATRWFSSRIGEGLIADLRRAVYAHVQTMPVAFFTRTRTGALVSRLNNDVIGAQSAITSTLASVVANAIQLTLAVAVMITLAWQVTVLALVLLPIFVIPARRMGRRIADLRREAADLNAGLVQPDDRTLLRARRHAGEAVRPAGRRDRRVRRPRRADPRHRGAHRDAVAGVRHRAVAGVGAGPGADLRPRRVARGHRARSRRAPSSPWRCCSPGSTRR